MKNKKGPKALPPDTLTQKKYKDKSEKHMTEELRVKELSTYKGNFTASYLGRSIGTLLGEYVIRKNIKNFH